jgi:hypothetical protein
MATVALLGGRQGWRDCGIIGFSVREVLKRSLRNLE